MNKLAMLRAEQTRG